MTVVGEASAKTPRPTRSATRKNATTQCHVGPLVGPLTITVPSPAMHAPLLVALSPAPIVPVPLAMPAASVSIVPASAPPAGALAATTGVIRQVGPAIYACLTQQIGVPAHMAQTLFAAIPSERDRIDLHVSGKAYHPACKVCSSCRAGKCSCELAPAVQLLNQMLIEAADDVTLHRHATVLGKLVRHTKALDAALPSLLLAPAGRAQAA